MLDIEGKSFFFFANVIICNQRGMASNTPTFSKAARPFPEML